MTLNLSNVTFDNDFFNKSLANGGMLVLNNVNESLRAVGETSDVVISIVNIVIISAEEDIYSCPCIIGLDSELVKIKTDHKEIEGSPLTEENMKFCTLEVSDEL